MSTAQMLGALLVALPFIAFFIFAAVEGNVGVAVVAVAITAVVVGVISAGCYLLAGGR